jgi:hypothetical protein
MCVAPLLPSLAGIASQSLPYAARVETEVGQAGRVQPRGVEEVVDTRGINGHRFRLTHGDFLSAERPDGVPAARYSARLFAAGSLPVVASVRVRSRFLTDQNGRVGIGLPLSDLEC